VSLVRLVEAARVVSRWFARAGGLMMFVSALLVSAEVVLRGMFSLAVLNSFEISIYLFAAAIAFGFAYALTERSHIRIDVLYARFPAPARGALDVLALAGLTALGGLFAWYAWGTAAQSAGMGAVSNSTLAVPLVLPQGVWVAGLLWFVVVAALLTVATAERLLRGDHAAVRTLGGAVSESEAAGVEGGGAA